MGKNKSEKYGLRGFETGGRKTTPTAFPGRIPYHSKGLRGYSVT
nr:MAG TPA: hypothetical protein [Caudoviricetes sp.]